MFVVVSSQWSVKFISFLLYVLYVRFRAFTAYKCAKISGHQQCCVKTKRFRGPLPLYHQGHITSTLMMETDISETLVFISAFTRLMAREDLSTNTCPFRVSCSCSTRTLPLSLLLIHGNVKSRIFFMSTCDNVQTNVDETVDSSQTNKQFCTQFFHVRNCKKSKFLVLGYVPFPLPSHFSQLSSLFFTYLHLLLLYISFSD
jgi:hypothetical protein